MEAPQPLDPALLVAGRSVADPQISPDGQWVSFVASGGERSELLVAKIGSDPALTGPELALPCTPAIKGVSATVGGVYAWLPSEDGVVYLGKDGCLYRLRGLAALLAGDVTASPLCTALTTEPAAIAALNLCASGDTLTYVVDMKDVYVLSLREANAAPRRVSSGADFAFDPVLSPNGRWVAWHEWDDPYMPWDNSRIVVRVTDNSEPIRTVAGAHGDDGMHLGVQQPRFSRDGQLLSFVSDKSGWANVWAVDTETFGNPRQLIDEPYEVAGPAWGPGQRSYCWSGDGNILYTRNDRGWGELRTNSGHIAEGSFTGLCARGAHAVAIANGPTMASSVRYIGLDGTDVEPQLIARGPVLGVESSGSSPEFVQWNAADGTVIPGRLYRAQTDADVVPPLMVMIHGGPTGQSPATLYARYCFYTQRGWSVLVPDHRGSTGWGREFQQALNGQWGVSDVSDVVDGVRAAIDNG